MLDCPVVTTYVDTGSIPDRLWSFSAFGPYMTGAGYWAAGHLAEAAEARHRPAFSQAVASPDTPARNDGKS